MNVAIGYDEMSVVYIYDTLPLGCLFVSRDHNHIALLSRVQSRIDHGPMQTPFKGYLRRPHAIITLCFVRLPSSSTSISLNYMSRFYLLIDSKCFTTVN